MKTMKYRIVKVVYPAKSLKLINTSISNVPFTKAGMNIYETVDFFKQKIFTKVKTIKEEIKDQAGLRDIINLHNDTGIKDISQIKSMVLQLKSGTDILPPDKLPSIKLVKTKGNKRVLFDGHHSMLSYMSVGRKYLNEVPHLIVENEKNEYVTDKEIIVFFGAHSKKLKHSDWKKYVINWQAPREKQLCRRIQKNMGELLKSILVYL